MPMGRRMGKVKLSTQISRHMMANGKIINGMERAFILIRKAISMKDNLIMIRNTVLENTIK